MRTLFRLMRALPRAVLAAIRELKPKDFESMLRPVEADAHGVQGSTYLHRKEPIPYWVLLVLSLSLNLIPACGFFIYKLWREGWPGIGVGLAVFGYYVLANFFVVSYLRCFYFAFLQYRLFGWSFLSNNRQISIRLQKIPSPLNSASLLKTPLYAAMALTSSLLMAGIAWMLPTGLGSDYFWLLAAYGPLMLLTRFLIEARTPQILLLGGSNPETTRLQRMLTGAFSWPGVVSLLDIEDHEHGKLLKMAFGSVRYPDTNTDWRDTFRFFADLVKIIVVDIRYLTPIVQEEVQWIRESGLVEKTYLLFDRETSRDEQWIGPSQALGAFLVTQLQDVGKPEHPTGD